MIINMNLGKITLLNLSLSVTKDILYAIDHHKLTDVLLDLQKAFSTRSATM